MVRAYDTILSLRASLALTSPKAGPPSGSG